MITTQHIYEIVASERLRYKLKNYLPLTNYLNNIILERVFLEREVVCEEWDDEMRRWWSLFIGFKIMKVTLSTPSSEIALKYAP